MFCCMLLYVHSSIAIILMGKRELIALPRGCLRFVIVVFHDHTHLLFLYTVRIQLYIFLYFSAISQGFEYLHTCIKGRQIA